MHNIASGHEKTIRPAGPNNTDPGCWQQFTQQCRLVTDMTFDEARFDWHDSNCNAAGLVANSLSQISASQADKCRPQGWKPQCHWCITGLSLTPGSEWQTPQCIRAIQYKRQLQMLTAQHQTIYQARQPRDQLIYNLHLLLWSWHDLPFAPSLLPQRILSSMCHTWSAFGLQPGTLGFLWHQVLIELGMLDCLYT